MEDKKELKEIYERATSKNKLFIKRVPSLEAKERFLKLAEEGFAGDYGYCLQYLVYLHDSFFAGPTQAMLEQINAVSEEVEALKSVKTEEPKKNVITSVGGTVIAELKGDKK